ncbi:hypothetical protein LGT41_0015360 [Abyssibius alkaniclasticus]|uniref:hypothetical protein n=1 Tax=Abyssibius alkaniclasticus TaxID=2881234 RepID=UPI002364754B|nr:hypothetical protein [Abyssibius alkaniclasticus]UPH71137.1 hypothetical protein LGT41_0015360 [Abyssibius alkaniclasticus]
MQKSMKIGWIAAITAAAVLTAAIPLLQPIVQQVQLAPDQGAAWYYWKRPDPNLASRATAWGLYVLNQVFFWGLIWWAKANRERLRDRNQMHPVNWIALAGMGVFGLLHYLQTALWYDGLAQDTSVASSQYSVIFLLVIVLIIEAPRRGLFFGTSGNWLARARPVLIATHGYYFAWAITYTFWFHPMVYTWGHLFGFFYTFLLMIQGALIFTRVHTNRYWTVLLEVLVLFHGTVVAITAGQAFWPMFFFGFLAIFVVTQMHGIGLGKYLRWAIGLAALAAVIVVYNGRGWGMVNEVVRIPAIDYLLVGLIGGLILLAQNLRRRS